MRRIVFIIALAGAAGAQNSTQAYGFTFHVPAQCPTIQCGIQLADDGDTVLVSPGTYVECVVVQGERKVLISVGGPSVTIISSPCPNDPAVRFQDDLPRGSILDGFTISGGKRGGIECINSAVLIRNNVIVGNRGYDTRTGGGINLIGTHSAIVEWNVIASDTAIYGTAVHLRNNAENDTIRHNLIHDNWGNGEIWVHGSEAVILNNSIVASQFAGIVGVLGASIDAKNNIVVGAPNYGMEAASGSTLTASHNCMYLNDLDYFGVTLGPGGLTEDPRFLDLPGRDFRLEASSPCVDAADPDPHFNDPDGSRGDIGAYYLCSPDCDGDSIADPDDNCPTAYNPLQDDSDANGVGDACECSCFCHGDPTCDGAWSDILDVTIAIDRAFNDKPRPQDLSQFCPVEPTDLDCSGATDIVDVLLIISVAVRGADQSLTYCAPCAP